MPTTNHPHTEFLNELTRPTQPARALGYRTPGEFEPIDAIWLTYPHNRETWPGCFDQACEQFDYFMSQAARFADVQLTGRRNFRTNDSWIRDYGPIFVTNGAGELACHDFRFTGWGGKYNAEYEDDDLIPQHVARLLHMPIWIHDLQLEGGSIDVNGAGTLLTTEQCLLNENRNPGKNRDDIVRELHDALGTRHVIWLPGGIVGDDTDGHIDDVARFIGPRKVVAVLPAQDHPDYAVLKRNFDTLRQSRDQDGKPLEVVALPAPEPILYDFPADRFGPGGRNPCPASYANFLIVNEAVLVPTFGQAADERALRVMEQAMPDRMIVPIRSEYLVVGLGALHCLSQHQPRST